MEGLLLGLEVPWRLTVFIKGKNLCGQRFINNPRYIEYQRMMNMGGYGSYGGSYDMGYNDHYYNDYYNRNRCRYGCPPNSYCQLGFCECNPGLTKIAVMNPS